MNFSYNVTDWNKYFFFFYIKIVVTILSIVDQTYIYSTVKEHEYSKFSLNVSVVRVTLNNYLQDPTKTLHKVFKYLASYDVGLLTGWWT